MPRKPKKKGRKKRIKTVADISTKASWFKKINLRAGFFFLFLAFFTIFDEVVKEGYVFDPSEVTIVGTHEFFAVFIFIPLAVVNFIIHFIKEKR